MCGEVDRLENTNDISIKVGNLKKKNIEDRVRAVSHYLSSNCRLRIQNIYDHSLICPLGKNLKNKQTRDFSIFTIMITRLDWL